MPIAILTIDYKIILRKATQFVVNMQEFLYNVYVFI